MQGIPDKPNDIEADTTPNDLTVKIESLENVSGSPITLPPREPNTRIGAELRNFRNLYDQTIRSLGRKWWEHKRGKIEGRPAFTVTQLRGPRSWARTLIEDAKRELHAKHEMSDQQEIRTQFRTLFGKINSEEANQLIEALRLKKVAAEERAEPLTVPEVLEALNSIPGREPKHRTAEGHNSKAFDRILEKMDVYRLAPYLQWIHTSRRVDGELDASTLWTGGAWEETRFRKKQLEAIRANALNWSLDFFPDNPEITELLKTKEIEELMKMMKELPDDESKWNRVKTARNALELLFLSATILSVEQVNPKITRQMARKLGYLLESHTARDKDGMVLLNPGPNGEVQAGKTLKVQKISTPGEGKPPASLARKMYGVGIAEKPIKDRVRMSVHLRPELLERFESAENDEDRQIELEAIEEEVVNVAGVLFSILGTEVYADETRYYLPSANKNLSQNRTENEKSTEEEHVGVHFRISSLPVGEMVEIQILLRAERHENYVWRRYEQIRHASGINMTFDKMVRDTINALYYGADFGYDDRQSKPKKFDQKPIKNQWENFLLRVLTKRNKDGNLMNANTIEALRNNTIEIIERGGITEKDPTLERTMKILEQLSGKGSNNQKVLASEAIYILTHGTPNPTPRNKRRGESSDGKTVTFFNAMGNPIATAEKKPKKPLPEITYGRSLTEHSRPDYIKRMLVQTNEGTGKTEEVGYEITEGKGTLTVDENRMINGNSGEVTVTRVHFKETPNGPTERIEWVERRRNSQRLERQEFYYIDRRPRNEGQPPEIQSQKTRWNNDGEKTSYRISALLIDQKGEPITTNTGKFVENKLIHEERFNGQDQKNQQPRWWW